MFSVHGRAQISTNDPGLVPFSYPENHSFRPQQLLYKAWTVAKGQFHDHIIGCDWLIQADKPKAGIIVLSWIALA